jgi:uncharacterized protein YyaL (SSP411 family)
MSVWLTPDLKPVHGGTYYPPNDRYYGQPGFQSLLTIIDKQVFHLLCSLVFKTIHNSSVLII